ncbi:peptidase associated/transthyretin-like domain-containing protein [Lutibacter flavus]|uniref:CarboxypepD_reg-like domain-containing protein n=1 Tax=Lutibacter flavus TaxID=691689 RepID=A0A238VT16_9FLAO|nr:hypothetical protein [Lutibacter flavus]SNR37294.1 hypothetical protein SAMN04488111_0984 [Lutibacter flavus]
MKLKLTNLTLLIFIATKSFSQESNAVITGKILSSNKVIGDVHIINLKNRYGTISNTNGEFEILVKEGDVLLFSSIQYKNIKITITKDHLKGEFLNVYLTLIVNNLDEVFLHGLTGSLDLDSKSTPNDTIPKANFVFKISDLDKKLPGDEFGYKGHVNAEAFTNPLYLAGGGQGSKYNKQLEEERAVKREVKRKTEFPIKLKKEFGIDFFINDLKIPEENIFNFITYCEYRDILDKYHSNKVLEVIEILKEESKKYNAIKK